ncbi:MAG: flagellar type III secretion system pore protein FliP [Buchnera aphidicola (Periphyllus acericola)]|uniref:flagellar type III secretion system pore protein FliP n=1 Tax=Buchnera aphidicola TaxID=9 RepID=UPI0030D2874E|nr:flagellar type III secretion system pore protein FliP [Buchnera aphidicola (Periphyllus acericola)]
MIYNFLLIFIFLFFSRNSYANDTDLLNNFLLNTNNSIQWSVSMQALLLITFIAFIPAIILMMTCFTRIIIVFSFLRSAIGTPYIPSNQILIGLSLFLTFFIMQPTLNKVYENSYIPFHKNKINLETAIQKSLDPFREFMLNQTRKQDLLLFTKLDHYPSKNKVVSMKVLIPSFITSELTTAFKIGFIIFIPFLIIDLLISSILMSLGMMMVPPSIISLPLKLIIFVLSDGWKLLISSLTHSFY